jgi:hypothetical protein|tara:strand:- start:14753 stop:14950 length:198 start_codon:yes stop_codon:yes gene_type:complete
MSLEKELRELVESELKACCTDRLPRLKAHIQTQAGMENAQAIIFRICETEGLSVQASMSALDSEL